MRVLIVQHQSLLVEGIITRLRQYRDRVDLYVVDWQQPNLLSCIVEIQPEAIIFDDRNPVISQVLRLDNLFWALPNLKIIQLNAEHIQSQLFRCEKHWVTDVDALLDLIEPTA